MLVLVTIIFLLTGFGTWLDGTFGNVLGGNNNSDDSEYQDMNYEQNNGIRNSNLQDHLLEPVQITNNSAGQYYPAIYENKLIWIDSRNGSEQKPDIYMYDLGPDGEFGNDDDIGETRIGEARQYTYGSQRPIIYEKKSLGKMIEMIIVLSICMI